MTHRLGFAAALLGGFAPAASAAAAGNSWYVDSVNGNCSTGNGSPGNPFCTMSQALAVATAGDTLVVAPGSYADSLTLWFDLHFVASGGSGATFWQPFGGAPLRALDVRGGVTADLTGFTIRSASSPIGGALVMSQSSVTIADCVFDANAATNGGSATGGAIYSQDSTLTLERVAFTGNSGEASGGAIHFSGGSLTATDCTFTANAAGRGAGLYTAGTASATLTRCTIENHGPTNTVTGAGIYAGGSSLVLDQCTLRNNGVMLNAFSYGGGLYVESGMAATATRTLFDGNSASLGGGLFAESPITLTDCEFAGNRAIANPQSPGLGGGLAVAAGLTMDGCWLHDNTADGASVAGDGGGGGALEISGSATVTHSRFVANRADGPFGSGRGGALFLTNGTTTFEECELIDNVADSSAAGIGGTGGALQVDHLATTTLRRCTLGGNGAASSGGAPAIGGSGGGILVSGGTLTLTGSIVAGNSAAQAGGAPDLGGTATSLDWNLIGDTTGATLTGSATHDLLGVDPLYVDAANGDYSLQASSPAVDTGDKALPIAGHDVGWNPRVLDGDLNRKLVVDRGAREFCRVHLVVTGSATPGGTLTFDTSGDPNLTPLLIAGVGQSSLVLKPFGTLFVDLTQLYVIVPWAPIPSSVDVDLDPTFPAPLTLWAQELGLGTRVGHLSNLVRIDVE